MAGRFVYNLVHFVWSTHERREWIAEDWENDLYAYVGGIARNKNATLLQAGGMPDHLHALVSVPPTMSISETVNALKANSSRWVHQENPAMKLFAWQEGYGTFSVSRSNEETVPDIFAGRNLTTESGISRRSSWISSSDTISTTTRNTSGSSAGPSALRPQFSTFSPT